MEPPKHGYLPELNAEYDFESNSLGTFIEAQVRVSAEEFFRDHWPTAFFVPECDQWHCSNCNAIFKQYSEPAISYCPWCGRKFIHTFSYRAPREKYDAAFLGKTMAKDDKRRED